MTTLMYRKLTLGILIHLTLDYFHVLYTRTKSKPIEQSLQKTFLQMPKISHFWKLLCKQHCIHSRI